MRDRHSPSPPTDQEHEALFFKRVGKNIREFRERHNTTQRELAKRAGLKAPYLNDVEKGRRNFSMRILLKLCKALDASPAKLLHGTERYALVLEHERNMEG
ncbi:helix-turn-helix domain-containing protein [Endozoicomonas atrinae]|uniref:helix-turn-helix domain-containing protein n=1 Tax=Endozoicomonas atrinae TaxID=1333660 RepID=UPI000B02711B